MLFRPDEDHKALPRVYGDETLHFCSWQEISVSAVKLHLPNTLSRSYCSR